MVEVYNRRLVKVDEESLITDLPPSEMKVIKWRLDQLERAGWPDYLAGAIAQSRLIDLHLACDLVQRLGCPPKLAADILL